ncbi:EAL domain-containing protein [Stenotrophomonas sp. MYb238]|nr:EAL domain-containing protein [Stenotrophomonas sp. MYb238]
MPSFRISLRTGVIVPFIAVFALAVGLLSFWQQRQVDRLINQESMRLLDAITTASRQQLVDYLETPLQVQHALAQALGQAGLYTPGDMRPIYLHLLRAFSQLYAQYDQISVLSFGGVGGEYTGVRRESDGRYRLILQDDSTHGVLQVFAGREPVAGTARSFPGYDPRVRPWYVHATTAEGTSWSPIYMVTGERGDVAMSASTVVKTADGMVGVAAADLRLSTMGRFLRTQPLRGNGYIAIIDAQDRLVAHSLPQSVLARKGDAYQPPALMRLSDSPAAALRAAARWLERSAPADGPVRMRFTEQGQLYHAQITPFHDPRGIDWRIVAVLPESDLVSSIRADSRKAMTSTLVLAVLGLAFGLWLLQRAIRPIQVTAQAAHRLARGEWDAARTLPVTPLIELSALVDAFNHMAQQLHQSFEQMRALLQFDGLTQLLTRSGLVERADDATADGARPAALCLLELQNFRSLRDDVGHHTGDQLLQAVADRLRAHLQSQALLARSGHNEFAVLWLEAPACEQAGSDGQQVLALFDRPFSVGEDDILLQACAGMVTGTLTPGALPEWLRNASIALSEAERGASRCVRYEPELAKRMHGRRHLAMELRQALEKHELQLHYQPVVDLATGTMRGAEALVRWPSPARGMVPPCLFIPVAEESDLILGIDRWVLHKATHDIAAHLPRLPPGFELHVNVSARELIQSDFVMTLEQALTSSALPPAMLTLELTESMLLDGGDATLQRIGAIKALGVKIAIDDFGTGYSSLAYLSRLRFDCIKIDQSFVRRLPASQADTAIVTAVLRIADGFGVQVVAEGVEEPAQAELLSRLGCGFAQGYLFARPAPLAQMLACQADMTAAWASGARLDRTPEV